MLCHVCYGMLHAQNGRRWQGTFDVVFNHHASEGSLKQSADTACVICSRLWEEWRKQVSYTHAAHYGRQGNFDTAYVTIVDQKDLRKRTASFQRYPSVQSIQELAIEKSMTQLYRLDFMTPTGTTIVPRYMGTFLLRQVTTEESNTRTKVYTPKSRQLDSDEVLRVARSWLSQCLNKHVLCSAASKSRPSTRSNSNGRTDDHHNKLKRAMTLLPDPPSFHPTRLIDLREKDDTVYLRVRKPATNDVTRSVDSLEGNYVTLSHCWGTDLNFKRFELRQVNLETFRTSGIKIQRLPRTFRDAIDFARKLDQDIRYIWIDSLCIIQQDVDDWLYESVQMHEVYSNAICNISATASRNSEGGLYLHHQPRDPSLLWAGGDTVEFNVADVHTPKKRTEGSRRNLRNVSTPLRQDLERRDQLSELGSPMRRCSVIDPSLWSRKVENAPVNRRAWVLQERLLAPRVIHFCDDQIAWECCELDAAECSPHGIPEFESDGGRIRHRVRLKGWISPRSRRDTDESDQYRQKIAHDNWKSIVELYSTTALTRHSDRLVALAGIAHFMKTQIGSRYVGGMWERHLTSQLLWYVKPEYEHGRFLYRSKRLWKPGQHEEHERAQYCAPTFSWAAIDAPSGISCGETVDENELLIKLQAIEVHPKSKLSPFGPLKDRGRIQLKCRMQMVSIEEKQRKTPDGYLLDMFSWKLKGDKKHWEGADRLRPLVYLDSPLDDLADMKGGRGDVFFVPVYNSPTLGLIGLLLQEDPRRDLEFRRVGLSRLPPYSPALKIFAEEDGSIKGCPEVSIYLY